jgi:hypothetical protein
MKRIIRLTESDLTRIVKMVIKENELGELDRSTWEKISQNVKGKGYDEFASRIKKHSREFGTGGEKYMLDFVTEKGTELSGELDDLPKFRNVRKNNNVDVTEDFALKLVQYNEDGEYDNTIIIECNVIYPREGDNVKLNLFRGDLEIKVSNKKSANNLINYLNKHGIKIPEGFKIDWRSFTKGY